MYPPRQRPPWRRRRRSPCLHLLLKSRPRLRRPRKPRRHRQRRQPVCLSHPTRVQTVVKVTMRGRRTRPDHWAEMKWSENSHCRVTTREIAARPERQQPPAALLWRRQNRLCRPSRPLAPKRARQPGLPRKHSRMLLHLRWQCCLAYMTRRNWRRCK